MTNGKLRRNLDLRLVSYAISVLNETDGNKELAVAARFLAAASLQLIGGYKALVDTCKASAESEAIRKSMPAEQAKRTCTLFDALAESLEEQRRGTLNELVELIVIFASECMDEGTDKHSLTVWANSLNLDTSPLVVSDEDSESCEIVEIGDPIKRRQHKQRKRSNRSSYSRDRFEDLIREAIAVGVETAKPKIVGGRIEILGIHPQRGSIHLRWMRSSMSEAEALTIKLNNELEKMRSSEPSRNALL
jgi:hypothetical protein